MPNTADIIWFKDQFGRAIQEAAAGTPFDLNMLAELACQETGYIWGPLRRKGVPLPQVLALCVGDTLDRPHTFPKDRADLERVAGGTEMLDSARAALINLAKYVPDYAGAAHNLDKFCKGFGIFQYDMQFFGPDTASYFLGGYANFAVSLKRCLKELHDAMVRAKIPSGTELTDMQKAAVAIAYNSGSYKAAKGVKQGYQSSDGSYYGENFYRYLQLAQSVPVAGGPAPILPQSGEAVLPPSTGAGLAAPYVVATHGGLLNLRSSPEIKTSPSNLIRGLPSGHPVSVSSPTKTNGFLQVEPNLQGAHLVGWAAAEFLAPASASQVIEELSAQLVVDTPSLLAVNLPLKGGTVIRRTELADAGSLNEGGQPGRDGTLPQQLKDGLLGIVAWLEIAKPAHKRYQPRSGLTFCNVYAHDFCHLAKVYLPRVWWSAGAIAKLSAGIDVPPRYGATIDELRANDLFRWLRDFGLQLGWRQTGTLTKLQLVANSGGIGVIVARRKEDGKSGHIVIVVPETEDHRAKWNAAGEVTLPLQTQAGAANFEFGTGGGAWWTGAQFAEFPSGFTPKAAALSCPARCPFLPIMEKMGRKSGAR